MSESREELEHALLGDPFDLDLRARYAALLLSTGDAAAAQKQYEMLVKQGPDRGGAHVGLAQALLALGRREDAWQRYVAARNMPGFSAVAALESLKPAQAGRMTVIAGGRDSNVVAFARTAPERIGFEDIAGLDELKRSIRLQIIEPFLNPALFARFKKRAGGGALLYGPPGCGKTMIAKAVATECRAQFMSVGISDVLNMFIGESERNLAAIFEKARAQQPCVLFFDEIDALAFSRSKAHSEHTRQVVNELLAQLDGFGSDNQGILVLAATNMPWDVDPAMKRPGRFSRTVFVPPPDAVARARIIELNLAEVPHEGVDAAKLAAEMRHFSGADIAAVVELAKDYVLEAQIGGDTTRVIVQADLARAMKASRASTLDWLRTAQNLVKYGGADDSYADVETYLKAHKL